MIENGNVADADEVMNAYGRTLKIYSNLVWNADLIGFDSSLQQDLENYEYDTLQDFSEIDQTNSEIKDVIVYGADVMDDFQDASIDANIWSTTGTVTETAGYLQVRSTGGSGATAVADQVNAEDFNRTGTILFKWTGFANDTGGADSHQIIKLIDESANEVTIKDYINLDSTITRDVRMEITPGSNNVEFFENDINGSGSSTSVDVTSLQDGDEWHLKFEGTSTAGGDTTEFRYLFIRFLSNAVTQNDFISEDSTSTSTITNAILVVSDDQDNGSIDYFLSADNGSNYEAVTANEIHRFSNTGTQLKVKAELNSTVDKVPILYHYAVQYNYY